MAITASEASADLYHLIAQVNRGGDPVVITCKGGKAVLISEDEYNSLLEMQYLYSTLENFKWLSESIAQVERGEVQPFGNFYL